MCILPTKSWLLSTMLLFRISFCSPSPFSFVIRLPHVLVFALLISSYPNYALILFSTHLCFLSHLFPLLSFHPPIYPEREKKEGMHKQKAVESYCAGGRRHVEDQTKLTHSSMNALPVCLSLPLLLPLPLHSLNLCISSIPPPPLSLFLHF